MPASWSTLGPSGEPATSSGHDSPPRMPLTSSARCAAWKLRTASAVRASKRRRHVDGHGAQQVLRGADVGPAVAGAQQRPARRCRLDGVDPPPEQARDLGAQPRQHPVEPVAGAGGVLEVAVAVELGGRDAVLGADVGAQVARSRSHSAARRADRRCRCPRSRCRSRRRSGRCSARPRPAGGPRAAISRLRWRPSSTNAAAADREVLAGVEPAAVVHVEVLDARGRARPRRPG